MDLTGYSAALHVRAAKGAASTLLELTSSGASIVLGGVAGTIQLLQTAAETAAYTFTSGVYDLELTIGAVTTRLLEGTFEVSPEVTI